MDVETIGSIVQWFISSAHQWLECTKNKCAELNIRIQIRIIVKCNLKPHNEPQCSAITSTPLYTTHSLIQMTHNWLWIPTLSSTHSCFAIPYRTEIPVILCSGPFWLGVHGEGGKRVFVSTIYFYHIFDSLICICAEPMTTIGMSVMSDSIFLFK